MKPRFKFLETGEFAVAKFAMLDFSEKIVPGGL
jgi:hypothetical protein